MNAFQYWQKLVFPSDIQNPFYYKDRLFQLLGEKHIATPWGKVKIETPKNTYNNPDDIPF
jgi:hypothetical protein